MQSQFGALVLQTISVLGWFRNYFWAGFGALRAVWGRLSAGFGASSLGAGFLLNLDWFWNFFKLFLGGFGDRFWGGFGAGLIVFLGCFWGSPKPFSGAFVGVPNHGFLFWNHSGLSPTILCFLGLCWDSDHSGLFISCCSVPGCFWAGQGLGNSTKRFT